MLWKVFIQAWYSYSGDRAHDNFHFCQNQPGLHWHLPCTLYHYLDPNGLFVLWFPFSFQGNQWYLDVFYIIKQNFIGVEGRELISIAGGGVRRKGKRVLFTQKYLHFVFIYLLCKFLP